MTHRVILLHGLWMNRLSMQAMAARLRSAGFRPEIFGYATVLGGPDAAIPRLVQRLREEPGHLLAHSLGGLVALSALQRHPELPVPRVVCLGSPLCGAPRPAAWPAASGPPPRWDAAPTCCGAVASPGAVRPRSA
jgi:pimeloyl-ACP methyl ester carboxylesterase